MRGHTYDQQVPSPLWLVPLTALRSAASIMVDLSDERAQWALEVEDATFFGEFFEQIGASLSQPITCLKLTAPL